MRSAATHYWIFLTIFVTFSWHIASKIATVDDTLEAAFRDAAEESTRASQIPNNTCIRPEKCGSLYSAGYVHDTYYSGLRRITKKAQSDWCRRSIEFEYMKHVRAIAEESHFPFENILYRTQCPDTSPHKPLAPVIKSGYITLGEESREYVIPKRQPPPTSSQAKGDEQSNQSEIVPIIAAPIYPERLSILYLMLVHDNAEFALRILNALDEPHLNNFVIHVDAKSDDVFEILTNSLKGRRNMHIMPQVNRQDLVWGAFSIVNATLQCMRHAVFDVNIPFDYAIDISGTTYPLKSNRFIRESLAAEPNTFFMETYHIPARPESHMWHQFVECDGALHRIARLPLVKGINMFLGSQWFAVPKHFVLWLLTSALPREYSHYAQYIIVADENYFSTMFFNSPYCKDNLRKTLLYQIFDKWEHERDESSKPKDPRKCLGLGDDTCGRSPSTLTLEYKYLLSSSRALFARKFDPSVASSLKLVDFIDRMRGTGKSDDQYSQDTYRWDHNKDDQGKRVMIRTGQHTSFQHPNQTAAHPTTVSNAAPAAEAQSIRKSNLQPEIEGARAQHFDAVFGGTANNKEQDRLDPIGVINNTAEVSASLDNGSGQCVTYMGPEVHYMALQPCNRNNPMQWFEIGRCTAGYEAIIEDGKCPLIKRIETGREEGNHISTNIDENEEDIFCSIYTRISADNDMSTAGNNPIGGQWGETFEQGKEICMDISGESARYGTGVIGYECTGKWNQLFILGDNCTISAVQPAIIGRVRGYQDDEVVTVCLDHSQNGEILVSAKCAHLEEQSEEPYKMESPDEENSSSSEWDLTAGSIVTESKIEGEVSDDPSDTSFAAMLRRQMRMFISGNNAVRSAMKSDERQTELAVRETVKNHAKKNYVVEQQYEFFPAEGTFYKRLPSYPISQTNEKDRRQY